MPKDVHPDNIKGNRGQFLPYQSKDIKEHQPVYQKAQSLLSELFEWIAAMVWRKVPHCVRMLICNPD